MNKLIEQQLIGSQFPDTIRKSPVKRLGDIYTQFSRSKFDHIRGCQLLTFGDPDPEHVCHCKKRLKDIFLGLLADKDMLIKQIFLINLLHMLPPFISP